MLLILLYCYLCSLQLQDYQLSNVYFNITVHYYCYSFKNSLISSCTIWTVVIFSFDVKREWKFKQVLEKTSTITISDTRKVDKRQHLCMHQQRLVQEKGRESRSVRSPQAKRICWIYRTSINKTNVGKADRDAPLCLCYSKTL